MKHLLRLSMIVLFTLSLSAQNSKQVASSSNAGVFQFESETIDYGTITQNSDGNRVFTFKNVGKSPIIISKVKSSCGCTVPTKPNKPVMPGEIAEISIKYATNRLGAFSKTISITSNSSETIKQIKIKGKVIKETL